ncbi:MAG: hypothetical protein ACHQ7M_04725 [Chloroflexota bacterium]
MADVDIEQLIELTRTRRSIRSFDSSREVPDECLKVHYAIPDPLEVYELVPVGWPHSRRRATPRRSPQSMIHWGRFEQDKLLSDQEMHDFLWHESRLGANGSSQAAASKELGMMQQ